MGEEGLRFVICRFATIFGVSPGMQFHTAVNKFSWQAVLGEPLSIWRTAINQKRPYLELGDAVRAIQFILKKNLFDRRVYNVLSTHATVADIVDILSSLLPSVSIEYVDAEGMNQISSEVSTRCFGAQGFQFRGSLREGIVEIIHLLQSLHPSRSLDELWNPVKG
jgi:nucleoside-diphosphate-sugar epimerase